MNENVLFADIPHTLGRGKLLVRKDDEASYLDLGHILSFNVTVETEQLDHFSSRSGIKKLDKNTLTQQTVKATLETDTPRNENLLLFFMGEKIDALNQASGSFVDEPFVLVFNRWTSIGKKNLPEVVVKNVAGTVTYTEGDDYVLDRKAGFIAPVEGGLITDGQTVEITVDYPAVTINKIVGAKGKNQKRHIWFIGDPAEGVIQEVRGFANLVPSGDLGAIGDEWQKFSLELKFLSHNDYVSIIDYYELGVQVST